MPDAEESGKEAGNDEDGEKDDERGCEAGRRHADEPVQLGPGGEHDGRRVVLGLLQGERQVARRHHLDDPVDADVLLLLTGFRHVTSLTGTPLIRARLSGRSDPLRSVRVPRFKSLVLSGRLLSVSALLRALVPADLNGTLEVHFHGIREFESLVT